MGSTEAWTTRRLLHWTTGHFERAGVDSPRVAAEMLLGFVLGVERLRLYMEPDRPASAAERERFRGLVQRAAGQEPVDYLVGHAPFFGLQLAVSPAVLIPRPSTEAIVERVLQDERGRDRRDGLRVVDIGTGSGAIAVTLAKHLPDVSVVATDVSDEALAVAKANAETIGVSERIDFRGGDLYQPVAGERFDWVLSNPPYISDAEWADVLPNVAEHEPVGALRAGADGLDVLRPLIAGAGGRLLPKGRVLFEHSFSQGEATRSLAAATGGAGGLRDVETLKDHEGLDRVLLAEAEG
ncbi:MAG: peptide chain release factor N(5)-glutamine methyltransferase [Planctomycetota bacterium]